VCCAQDFVREYLDGSCFSITDIESINLDFKGHAVELHLNTIRLIGSIMVLGGVTTLECFIQLIAVTDSDGLGVVEIHSGSGAGTAPLNTGARIVFSFDFNDLLNLVSEEVYRI
jgi:hypothetical protein